MRQQAELGLTLVEMLVSLAVFSVIIVVIATIFNGTTKLTEADTGRITADQNTQTALDIVTADVKQAGENLSLQYGVSGIEYDTAGDWLTVRKGLTIPAMSVCTTPSSNPTTIQVLGAPVGSTVVKAACAYSDGDGDGNDDSLVQWQRYFVAQGSQPLAALLFSPASGSTLASAKRIVVTDVGAVYNVGTGPAAIKTATVTVQAPGANVYTPLNNSIIVLVDERRYFRDTVANQLKLAVGGQTNAQAQIVAFNTSDFSPVALLDDGTLPTSMSLTGPWSSIKQVQVTMTGSGTQGRALNRTYRSDIFPRNVVQAR